MKVFWIFLFAGISLCLTVDCEPAQFIVINNVINKLKSLKQESHPLKKGARLSDLKQECAKFDFISIRTCDEFTCFSSYDDSSIEVEITQKSWYNICDSESIPGISPENDLENVYKVSRGEPPELSSIVDENFCGCISNELFSIFYARSPYVDDNKNLVTGAKVSNGKVEILSATSSLRIRPWDLKSECFHMWFPFTKSFKTLGSDNVVAVYAKNCDLLYVDSINSSSITPTEYDTIFFSNQPFCVGKGQGFEYVLMSPTECATYNLKEIKKLSVDLNIDCTQCQDDPDLDCGSIDSYSVYVNYQGRGAFFQVLDPGVHDHPEDVLDSSLIKVNYSRSENLTGCFDDCQGFDYLTISSDGNGGVNCRCLSGLVFNSALVSTTTIYSWCPGVSGPCFQDDVSVVYCVNLEKCKTSSIRMDNLSGVCKFGEEISSANETYWCLKNDTTGLETLTRKDQGKCETIYDGQFWSGILGENKTLECGKGFTGQMTWECGIDGNFKSLFPNCSNCRAAWIDDINDLIKNDSISAVEISEIIIDNLLDVGVKEGDFRNLSLSLNAMIAKREKKPESTDILSANTFSFNIRDIIDMLFGMDENWKRLETIPVYNLTGELLRILFTDSKLTTNLTIQNNLIEKFDFNYFGKTFISSMDNENRPFSDSSSIEIRLEGNFTDSFELNQSNYETNLFWTGNILNFVNLPTSRFSSEFVDERKDKMPGELFPTLMDFSTIKPVELSGDQRAVISFFHPETKKNRICVFWDPDGMIWKTGGCSLIKTLPNETVCVCDHLTTLSAMFGDWETPPTEIENLISYFLNGLSCLALSLTLVFLVQFNKKQFNFRRTVELNRNLTHLVGLFLFVFISELDSLRSNHLACSAFILLTHFMWVATFAWTAVEGNLLYNSLVVVFENPHRNKLTLYLFAYGSSAIVAGTTLGIALFSFSQEPEKDWTSFECRPYCQEKICWLGGMYTLGIAIPVASMFSYNIVVLCTGLFIAHKASRKEKCTNLRKTINMARNLISLSYLLGMNWVLGVLLLVIDENWLKHLFNVINSSSGIFIFIYTVIYSSVFKDLVKKYLPQTTKTTSADSSKNSRNFPQNTLKALPLQQRPTNSETTPPQLHQRRYPPPNPTNQYEHDGGPESKLGKQIHLRNVNPNGQEILLRNQMLRNQQRMLSTTRMS